MHPEERILQHWREKLAAQPANNNALIGVVKSLALLDRVDEVMAIAQANADKPKLAEWILRVAAGALPQNPELGIAYCRLAEDAGDQAQADKRWIMLRRRQPASRLPISASSTTNCARTT